MHCNVFNGPEIPKRGEFWTHNATQNKYGILGITTPGAPPEGVDLATALQIDVTLEVNLAPAIAYFHTSKIYLKAGGEFNDLCQVIYANSNKVDTWARDLGSFMSNKNGVPRFNKCHFDPAHFQPFHE